MESTIWPHSVGKTGRSNGRSIARYGKGRGYDDDLNFESFLELPMTATRSTRYNTKLFSRLHERGRLLYTNAKHIEAKAEPQTSTVVLPHRRSNPAGPPLARSFFFVVIYDERHTTSSFYRGHSDERKVWTAARTGESSGSWWEIRNIVLAIGTGSNLDDARKFVVKLEK